MSGDQHDRITDMVEALIRAGGRRADPPADAYRAVFEAAERTLHAKLARRRRWRVGAWLAAAAGLGALAVGLGPSLLRTGSDTTVVARVDRVQAVVRWRQAGEHTWVALASLRRQLTSGGTLRTAADSGVGLLYSGGLSLRLGASSEIELTDATHVTLRNGTLYLATGDGQPARLEIVTPIGRVHHVGTQFELKYHEPTLRLRVREGSVEIDTPAQQLVAVAGEELTVGTSGDVERQEIASDDPDWRWVESLVPVPDFDGRSAHALLEWAARETGHRLVYANDEVERHAASVILHGQAGTLPPIAMLDTMLATTDLDVDLEADGRMRVHTR